MSLGGGIPFNEAYDLAKHVSEELTPACAEVKAVGSLRRRRDQVGDLEFLVRPRMRTVDLFGGEAPDIEPIRAAAESLGPIAKGGDRYLQIRNVLGSLVDLDVFVVWSPANWHCLLAIRTGPSELSRLAVTRMRSQGLAHVGGRIVDAATGVEHPVASEEDFFAAANLVTVAPHLRDTRAAMQPLQESFRAKRYARPAGGQ